MIKTNNELTSQKTGLPSMDTQYSIDDFRNIFEEKQNVADKVINAINNVVFDADLSKTMTAHGGDETRYVVDMSEDMKDAIQKGKIKLDMRKSGEIFAQIKDADGHYGKKLPIKEELISQGVDPLEVTTAMQTRAIQMELEDIMDTLNEIGSNVEEIIQGLQNDRIGLYYSGLNLFLESRNINDDIFKKLVLSQALKALSDANAQMIQSIEMDIRYIVCKEYKKGNGKSAYKIKEKMDSINKCFEVIYRSSVLKAAIYYENNEMGAMLTAFDEYGKFLNELIVPYAGQLSEHDENDVYLTDGIWEKKSGSFALMENVKNMLDMSTVYYIEAKEGIHD